MRSSNFSIINNARLAFNSKMALWPKVTQNYLTIAILFLNPCFHYEYYRAFQTIRCYFGRGLLLLFLMSQSQRFFQIVARLGNQISRNRIFIVLKHLIYSIVLGESSRAQVLTQLTYWTRTGVCTFLVTHSLSDIGKCAGNIAFINFIPLIFNDRLSLLADPDLLGFPPAVINPPAQQL